MPKKTVRLNNSSAPDEWKPESVSSGASKDNVPFFPQPLIPNSNVDNNRPNSHAALEGYIRAGKR